MSRGWLGLLAGTLILLGDPQLAFQDGGVYLGTKQVVALEPELLESQGDHLLLNGQEIRGEWVIWKEDGERRLGIESMALEKSLGFELLDSQQSKTQPIAWFDRSDRLDIRFINLSRYLDITELAKDSGWQWQGQGNLLALDTAIAKILDVRTGNQTWGKRIVIDLDAPVAWRLATPSKISIQARMAADDAGAKKDEWTLPPLKPIGDTPKPKPKLPFNVTTGANSTVLNFSDAIASQIEVTTLANPPRLVIDLRQQNTKSRSIEWLPGITWRQKNVVLPDKSNGGFGVTWLEVDPTQNNFRLAPISPSDQSIVGLAPMVTQTKINGAIAAINAGFFNRNNQYPLGAVRTDGEWRSSPILNRGAIAWNNEGDWQFDRLSYREELVASNGERLTIDFLNSGYVKAGVSRYTKAWGDRYRTSVDNEVILVVESRNNDEIITHHKFAGKSGKDSYVIPEDGYLLVFRSFRSGAAKIPAGTTIQRSPLWNPRSFADSPNIMGAGPLLIKNGRIVLNGAAEQFSKAFNIQSASRSAIARTRQGKILLATVHGTAAESSGASLQEWSELLLRLGATDALNLDGGGSSALVLGGDLGDRHSSTVGRVNNGIGLFIEE